MSLRITCFLALVTATCHAGDWPCWRGPNHNGISTETGWLHSWKTPPPIAWKASVGTGFSSVVVADGRAYTLGHADDKDTVFCFDAATGKRLWAHSYEADLGDKYFEGGTTGTPTVDGDSVYTLSRWGDLFCFESATGKTRWSSNVQKDAEMPIPTWGWSGSPLVVSDLLVLNVGEFGMALNKKTGKTVWTTDKQESGYSTPLPIRIGDKPAVLLGSARSYAAVDVATGKPLWQYRWITRYGVNAADPIVTDKHVLLSTGYNKGATLLRRGDGEPTEVWRNKNLKTQMNPAVLLDGFVYGISGDGGRAGDLVCLDLATGKVRWTEENTGTGALMAADGKLIVLTEKGELLIAPATPKGFSPTAKAKVTDGKCWTVPVLANGRIYCRDAAGSLVCVDVRKNRK